MVSLEIQVILVLLDLQGRLDLQVRQVSREILDRMGNRGQLEVLELLVEQAPLDLKVPLEALEWQVPQDLQEVLEWQVQLDRRERQVHQDLQDEQELLVR